MCNVFIGISPFFGIFVFAYYYYIMGVSHSQQDGHKIIVQKDTKVVLFAQYLILYKLLISCILNSWDSIIIQEDTRSDTVFKNYNQGIIGILEKHLC